VFTVASNVNGKPAIRISGEVFGELRTTRIFKDYHLKLQFKWGKNSRRATARGAARRRAAYHVRRPRRRGRTWARSIELQIQEHDVGDLPPSAPRSRSGPRCAPARSQPSTSTIPREDGRTFRRSLARAVGASNSRTPNFRLASGTPSNSSALDKTASTS
jgi:hypothetical protein